MGGGVLAGVYRIIMFTQWTPENVHQNNSEGSCLRMGTLFE